ncbi:MAG: chemotaxis protein CheW [Gammaproteobacteria bacterium]|nr:chemotaxis protein CheW [Gammaproteobacteria bacterium]
MSLPVTRKAADLTVAKAEEGQYLTFTLSGKMYAIGILFIKEILEFGQLTTVPMMPEFIRGVINLRGAVVPVVDLSARFGGKQSDVTKRTCIVIIEVLSDEGRQDIGVVVDTVSEVLEIPASEIEPAPAFGARIRTDFIRGMGKINGKFVIILNVDKVLSVDELAVVGQAANLEAAQLPEMERHA